MSDQPNRAGRHCAAAPTLVQRIAVLGNARTAVKGLTAVGLLLGSAAVVAVPSAADAQPTATASASDRAAGLLADRGADGTTSRSAARAAVTAPDAAKATSASLSDAGDLDVVAVAKPKPKPKPKPEATESTTSEGADTATGSSSTSSDAGSDSSSDAGAAVPSTSVNTGAFAAQAAALGLGPNAAAVYSAVRTQFPSMTNIGGFRAGDPGDHGSGRAVDIMVTGAPGDAVASYLQANAGRLNIKYLIWKQQYWQPGGSWRMMADRGSATQNHYDHVHVSVY